MPVRPNPYGHNRVQRGGTGHPARTDRIEDFGGTVIHQIGRKVVAHLSICPCDLCEKERRNERTL